MIFANDYIAVSRSPYTNTLLFNCLNEIITVNGSRQKCVQKNLKCNGDVSANARLTTSKYCILPALLARSGSDETWATTRIRNGKLLNEAADLSHRFVCEN